MFIVVAIVIFGIFVSLSYTLFGKTLQPQVVQLFEQGIEQANTHTKGIKTIYSYNSKDIIDRVRFTTDSGVSFTLDDNDLYNRQDTFRWDFKNSGGVGGLNINLTEKETKELKVGDTITFDYILKTAYGGGTLRFNLGGSLKGSVKEQKIILTTPYLEHNTTLEITENNLSDFKKGNVKITMHDLSAVVWFGKLDIQLNYK